MATTVERKPGSRDRTGNEILLGVLELVELDQSITQRSVAKELGIALGLANAYLKRCIHKGFVKVRQVPPRRYAYYLTPQGFSEKSRLTANYLAYSFSFFRQARAQLGDIFTAAASRGQRKLVLIGEGDLAEIATLVVRNHPVEISATIAAQGPAQLATALNGLDAFDAAVITALHEPRNLFEAAGKILSPERVYVPDMLRVATTAHPQGKT